MVWFSCKYEHCQHCGSGDYEVGICEPRTLLICECCQYGAAHVKCEEDHKGVKLTEEGLSSGHTWYCSRECEQINGGLLACLGKRSALDGSYTLEVASATAGRGRGAVDAAKRLLKSCFDPLVMDNGMDLIDMMCNCYDSPLDAAEDEPQYNFSAFKVCVLRKGAICVSAAVLRVFGATFAEMPFVATREGYRREGNLRRLLRAVESKLIALGVRRLVVQSVRSLLPMWLGSLGFLPLTLAEADTLDPLLVSPDPDSAQLIKKTLIPGADYGGGIPEGMPAGRPTVGPATGGDAALAAAHLTLTPKSSAASVPGLQQPEHAAKPPQAQQQAKAAMDGTQSTPGTAAGEGSHAALHNKGAGAASASGKRPEHSGSAEQKSQGRDTGAAASWKAAPQTEPPLPAPELGQGWTRVKHVRPSGRSEWIFHAPGGRTFRSKKQAHAHADVLQGKQPAAAPTGATGPAAAEGLQKNISPAKRSGSMLPPPSRAPKKARDRGAAAQGVPLLPSSETRQCQQRHLDRAMAQRIAEAVQRYIKGAAEESLSREQELQDRISRLEKENQGLRQARAADGVGCMPGFAVQPAVYAAGGSTLSRLCTSLNSAIHSTAAGTRD